LLFFAALVYLLVRLAGWVIRFFRGKAEDEEEAGIHLDIPEEEVDFVFPGGDAEIEMETEALYLLLPKAHPKDLVRLVLVGGAVYFAHLEDKSESKIVAYLRQLSRSAFTPEEARIIHDFIYTLVLRVQYQGHAGEDTFDLLNDVPELTGCDADRVPDGHGAFGFAITNPVPVKGVISNEYYLSRLRTADGKRITWERVGSRESPQSGKPVDLYRIFDGGKTEIARLFIAPYHKRVSNQSPAGFRLLTRADAAAR
jgi:hypothetical protein